MKHLPQSGYTKGLWRNGRGVSWDIASNLPFSQNGDFGWRFAVAEIAQSGPFSVYGPVDRVFTLAAGDGLRLDFADGRHIDVNERFVPYAFACDIATQCTLFGGPAKALNLFTARGRFAAGVTVLHLNGEVTLPERASLAFVLQGSAEISGSFLPEGDAAELDPGENHIAKGRNATLYVANLTKLP